MDDRSKLGTLQRLITDEDFNKLKDLSNNVNIYRITGIGPHEIRHSNTIAWFLNPNEKHNLGPLFFQKYMTHLFEKNPDYFHDKNLNILDFLLNDPDDAQVIREKEENIDIFFISKNMGLLICIENKVKSDISDHQLDKYYEHINKKYGTYKKIFVLLSPSGYDVPGSKSKHPEAWISSSYTGIVEIFRSILELNIDQKMQYVIKDYIDLLEKERIVEDKELNKVLESLYAKHKDAVDLLFEYKKDVDQSPPIVPNLIKDIFVANLQALENKNKIIRNNKYPFDKDTLFLIFYSKYLDNYLPHNNDSSGSWNEGSKYRYWIDLRRPKKLRITFELGPLGQDNSTIEKMNKIRQHVGFKNVTASDRYRQTKHWEMDIVWLELSADDIDEKHIQKEIDSAFEEIFKWESKMAELL